MFIIEHTDQHLHDLENGIKFASQSSRNWFRFYDKSLDRENKKFLQSPVLNSPKLKASSYITCEKSTMKLRKNLGLLQFEEGGYYMPLMALQHAKAIFKGFKLGFGGNDDFSYARSVKIRELAKTVPLESIVLKQMLLIYPSSSSTKEIPCSFTDNFNVLN
jgi:hypothetical protein